MVMDTLDNLPLYKELHPAIARISDFITSGAPKGLPTGKTMLEAEKVFASVSDYVTKTQNEARWESHRLYADIQLLLSGEERIGFAPAGSLSVIEDYDDKRDISFYAGTGDYLTLKPGLFAMFFPDDAHQPGVLVTCPVPVRKIVFKVRLDDI